MKPHRKIVLSRTVGAFVAAVVSCSAGVLALPAHAEDTTNDNTTVQTPTTDPTTPTANPTTPTTDPTTPTTDPTTEAPASPLISTDSLPKATYNTAYNTSVKAENFTGNATFTAEGLPDGLNLAKDGTLSGTPAKSGSFTVKVTAKTDDNTVTKSYALFVYEAPALADEKDGATLPTGEVNKAYSYQYKLSADTYDAPTFKADKLPAGLAIDAATGVISGTPTEYGSFTPTITVTNEGGTLTLKPTLTVNSPLSLNETSLKPAKVGDAYSATLTFKGNPAASSSKVDGLPTGLKYEPTTGTISGTPTKSGVFELTVAASNGVDPSVSTKLTLTVNAAPVVTTAALPDATYAHDYSQKIDVAAYPAATVKVSGLPKGLAYNAETGKIEGAPAVAGEFTVTVKASNEYGTVSKDLHLLVKGTPVISTTQEDVQPATVGSAYSLPLDVTGSPAPQIDYTKLPAGLSFDTQTNTVKGTVTAAPGVYPVTFTAKNSEGTASVTLSIRVNEKPVFKTQSLPDGSTLSEYKTKDGKDVQVVADGLGVTFSSKDLPAGLSLDAESGVISGTPSKGGKLTFTVTATNDLGSTDQQYTIEVSEPAAVSTQSLAPVVAGKAYEQAIETTGYPDATVKVDGLPAGLSHKDGKISGTVAADAIGSYQVTVKADNKVGDKAASKTFTLYVASEPVINTESLADAVAGSKYSIDLDVQGAPDLDVTVDGLPDGVTYYAPTKTISGFPTKEGEYPVTVTATTAAGQLKATKDYKLRVTTAASISTDALKDGLVGQQYDQAIDTAGFPAATVKVDGLPDGLAYNAKTGAIEGTPKTVGTSTVTVKASNGIGDAASKTLTLTVNEVPVIKTESLKAAQTGVEYSEDVTVTGTPAPKVEVFGLPAGLSYKDGKISGTPTKSGESTVTVSATNGTADPVTKTLTLTVNEAASITTDALKDGVAGQAYNQAIETAGFPAATVKVDGLPDGLAYNAKTGAIEGTPKTVGTSTVTVKASNGIGDAASKTLTLTVNEVPVIKTESLKAATIDTPYSADVTVTGTPAATVTVEGLPAGLEHKDGKIAGTPTASGEFTVTVKASNKAGSVSKDIKLTVNAPASIETGSLVDGTVGQTYTQSILTSGFPAATVTVEGLPEGLPEGLEFDTVSNTIKGTPKTAGTSKVTVTASNGIGEKVEKTFELTVNAPASIVTESLKDGIVGQAYSQPVETAGFPAAETVKVDGLPDGLSYADGQIAGTPKTAGTSQVKVTASNGIGDAASKTLTLTVNQAAAVTTTELPAATQYTAYSADITATGSPAPSVTVEGDLPAGLTYADGKIQGTPTQTGEFKLTVKAGNGVAADATAELTLTVAAIPSQTVYRVYNPNSGEHMFTTDQSEYDHLAALGWQQEGSAWRYLVKSDKKIYRLYNPNGGVHHFTTDENEYDQLAKQGWQQEGVAGYAADESFGVAVYRLYNPNDTTGAHHFTTDKSEAEKLAKAGWVNEGIAFYALPAESATDTTDKDTTDTDTDNTDTDTTDTDATDTDDTKVTE